MRRVPHGGQLDFEPGWKQISRSIDKLFRSLTTTYDNDRPIFSQGEYLSTHNLVVLMCTAPAPKCYDQALYDRHETVTRSYMDSTMFGNVSDLSDLLLLKAFSTQWGYEKTMNKWLGIFFGYLHMRFTSQRILPRLDEQCISCFRECVFNKIKVDLAKALFNQIDQERDGLQIDRDLLRNCIEAFVQVGPGPRSETNLDIYEEDFQAPFLTTTLEYYERKAAEWLLSMDVSQYLFKVEVELENERDRIKACLQPCTEEPLLDVLESVLLVRPISSILENEDSGVKAMLQNDRKDDLSRLFRLYSRIQPQDGLEQISRVFEKHVKDLGICIVKERQRLIAIAEAPTASRGAASAAAVASAGAVAVGSAGGASGGSSRADSSGGSGGGRNEKDSDGMAFIRALLDLQDKARGLVKEQFREHPLFQTRFRDSFTDIVNIRESGFKFSCIEVIVAFVNSKLTSSKDAEDEVLRDCDRIVDLFSHIFDKDAFAVIYKKSLAKRLMREDSSLDLERHIISKLKLLEGATFTQNMEGMLNDLVQTSLEKGQDEYKKWARANGLQVFKNKLNSDLTTIKVLTNGKWPEFPHVPELKYPPIIQAWQDQYKAFYLEKSKRLTFQASAGSVSIAASFDSGNYELIVSPLQAVLLNVFNQLGSDGPASAVTLSVIRNAMGMPNDSDAIRIVKIALHSLACGKEFEVLSKIPRSTKIELDDTFHVNLSFSSRGSKVRIPMASLETKSKESAEVEVDAGRRFVVQAAAVRIMKTRRTCKHSDLVMEIVKHVKTFQPDQKFIKSVIEGLLNAGQDSDAYIERDGDDPTIYHYIA